MAIIKTPVSKPLTMRTTRTLIHREGTADSDDFSSHIDEVSVVPTLAGGSSFTAIDGSVVQDPGAETWAATLNIIQDRDPDGLLRYLLAHTGTKAEIRCRFASDDTDELVFTVTLTAAGFGGKSANIATSNVTFTCDAAPAFAAVGV